MLSLSRSAARATRVAALVGLALAGPAAAQDAAGPDTVVATVGGASVTLADVQAVMSELPAQYRQAPDDVLYDYIRQQLVDQRLLAAAAEADGLADEPAVAQSLRLQREGLLSQAYVSRQVEERMTEEALREAYQTRIETAPAVAEVRASHILVASEELAQEVRAKIEEGASFADMATEYGTDGTKNQGGDLGFFTRDMMVAPFADAAFAMEVGAVSQPVQTQFGWHLIELTDRREQPKPSFEEVREALEQELGSAAAQEIVQSVRAGGDFEMVEDRPGLDALRAAE
ncbi:peptidylprolyl isomerase [Rubrimonas cliftonensis]|uniref:Parvulin-like PPIase n=1 Tax=Rubrimonas cliftonensis TaxID=89524 RepID=A0A1H4A6Y7_9RHOB|nr:peptidylprolyl isomerase [Rubrimonas cliftonensis]SEA31697.1 peptidyl-prolyl cis-trans isomerase C [Rubrimonas cliftonensis]